MKKQGTSKTGSVWIYILTVILMIAALGEIKALAKNIQVTFYVQWYDVGKSALEGLEGTYKKTSLTP